MMGNRDTREYIKQNKIDAEIVKKIILGDASAFENLFRLYYQVLVDFCFLFVSDVSNSENIVQEVFLKIWENRAKLDPDTKIKWYLYRATKNKAIDYLRHLKVTRTRAAEVYSRRNTVKTPDEKISQEEMAESLSKEIEKLPDKNKLIFFMSKYEKLNYSEIAEIQNISVKTVENHMVRSLKFLRKRIHRIFRILCLIFFL